MSVTGGDEDGRIEAGNESSDHPSDEWNDGVNRHGSGIEPTEQGNEMVDSDGTDASVGTDAGDADTGDTGDGELTGLFGESVELSAGYVSAELTDINPSVILASVVLGGATARTEADGALAQVVLMRMDGMCLDCDGQHAVGPLEVMLPVPLVRWMIEGLTQAIEGTITEHANAWMDGELGKILDAGTGDGGTGADLPD